MLPINTILHPTDFSQPSTSAFQLACSLARDHDARLIVLHVVPPPAIAFGEMIAELSTEESVRRARERLEQVRSMDPHLPIEHRLEEGDPAGQILTAAEETNSDLIVMGTHGRTGLTRLLMGSVAEQVVRRAACPVLTVKSTLLAPVAAAEHESAAI